MILVRMSTSLCMPVATSSRLCSLHLGKDYHEVDEEQRVVRRCDCFVRGGSSVQPAGCRIGGVGSEAILHDAWANVRCPLLLPGIKEYIVVSPSSSLAPRQIMRVSENLLAHQLHGPDHENSGHLSESHGSRCAESLQLLQWRCF